MIIRDIEFVGSFERESQCPVTDKPEYAFIGRSNVGKSSLINALSGKKGLAHISSTPGKTQTINCFKVNEDEWYLIDLPGYGYAKISKSKRKKWKQMIDRYLQVRSNLFCIFLLIDSRLKLQDIDVEFMNWLGEHHIPFVIAFTKIDKLNKADQVKNIEMIKSQLKEHWDPIPQCFVTSAEKKRGLDEILNFIDHTNKGLSYGGQE